MALKALADELCGGRWVATGGGGYALVEAVPRTWTHLLAIATGEPLDPATLDSAAWQELAGNAWRGPNPPGLATVRRGQTRRLRLLPDGPGMPTRMTDGARRSTGRGRPGGGDAVDRADPGDPAGGLPAAGLDPLRPAGLSRGAVGRAALGRLDRPRATDPPDDADRIVALHSRFSDRTRYLRYFSPYPRIPARDLERFVNVDHHDREALVVGARRRPDRGRPVRAARAGARRTPRSRSWSRTRYQGRGIGSLLLEHLAEAARGRASSASWPRCCRRTGPCCGSSPTPGSRSAASTPMAWCT